MNLKQLGAAAVVGVKRGVEVATTTDLVDVKNGVVRAGKDVKVRAAAAKEAYRATAAHNCDR